MTVSMLLCCQNPKPVTVVNRRVLTVGLMGMFAGAGLARAQSPSFAPLKSIAGPSQNGFAWLRHIDEAASRYNFQGITVVSGKGALISTTRLTHLLRGGQLFEHLEPLDARGSQVLRMGEQVQMVLPGHKNAVPLGQQGHSGHYPALLHGAVLMPLTAYRVELEGLDRVAGHEAQVLLVKPRDAHRFGLRLWADRRTALLLRVDTLGLKDEEVLETWAFADLKTGFIPQAGQLRRLMWPFRHGAASMKKANASTFTQLEIQGWVLKPPVPGFEVVNCVMQALPKLSADAPKPRGAGRRDGKVLQAVYSDGLARVSLFIEPFDATQHQSPGHTAIGLTQTITSHQGDWWITAVGAVPQATLQSFVRGLQRLPS